MEFALERVYPRLWLRYNTPRRQRRGYKFDSLESVIVSCSPTPSIKGRSSRKMDAILNSLPVGVKFTIADISNETGFAYKTVSRAIWSMIDKGHPLSAVQSNNPAHMPKEYIYKGVR